MRSRRVLCVPMLCVGLAAWSGCDDATRVVPTLAETPTPKGTNVDQPSVEKATFAAGCFWGVEAAFRQVPGVVRTAVGYTGGTIAEPTYKAVCTDTTGHAEAVLVEFDPAKVSYERLLDVFWKIHDPTTLNRQGPDVGTQYRSAVFYHTPEQQAAVLQSKQTLEQSGKFGGKIVTRIVPAARFWPAEEYHQRYLEKRGLSQCHIR